MSKVKSALRLKSAAKKLDKRPADVYTSKDRAVHWDGRNNEGEKVSSGMYFYHLRAGGFEAVRRMIILK